MTIEFYAKDYYFICDILNIFEMFSYSMEAI